MLEFCSEKLGLHLPMRSVASPSEYRPGELNILDAALLTGDDLEIGRISRKVGAAAVTYVRTATQLAIGGDISAVVTLPLNKEAVRHSDPSFTGPTELIAQTRVGSAKMLRDSGRHPVELRESVTSPGGTPIAAIRVLEQERVRGAFINAIEAATLRSRELAGG